MIDPSDVDSPETALLALSVVTVALCIVTASTSTAAFGAFNSAWDGTSEVREYAEQHGSESRIVRNTTAYPNRNPNETLAVVLSPETAYDSAAAARVERFVKEGGTLLVAGDFGRNSNRLLRDIGANASLDGRLVRDERYNHRSPAMPVARNVSNHPLATGVNALVLNHGTVVRPNGSTVLIGTSRYAYLDGNRNGEIDDAETVTSFPIVTIESVGRGQVIVISDPSIFINAMFERSGNEILLGKLLDGHRTVLFDYSHAGSLPPLAVAVLVLRESVLFQLLFGLFGVGLLAVLSRRNLRATFADEPDPAATDGTKRREESREELVAYLERRYPEWETDRIEQMVESFRKRRP